MIKISPFVFKLIYVFRINDKAHKGCLKIGEATCEVIDRKELTNNCEELNKAANSRIRQYTRTAAVEYELLHTDLAVYKSENKTLAFSDRDVHSVLLRSGVRKETFNKKINANEWFITDLETVKAAIKAVKEGRKSLNLFEITEKQNPIVFRPEQREAIDFTKKRFRKTNSVLWNAKMRFGKTLSALQVVKDQGYTRTLILTHRPTVNEGWFDDFRKIFYDKKEYSYGSRNNGESFFCLENRVASGGKYVYFASIQNLRGSERVGGKFDKNDELFSADWDLLVIDEAHEGTQTELGISVFSELKKPGTKLLQLSGTPFNLLEAFKEEDVFTWDYLMEQRAKEEWDTLHVGDPNPYASLPKMNIYTYKLGETFPEYAEDEYSFNFREFFRVKENGKFLREEDVAGFLNLLCRKDDHSLYPFSNDNYRNLFRHSLWIVPGVREAKALEELLRSHEVFKHFQCVNVAGEGNFQEEDKDPLSAVKAAIGESPENTYTITISCGRLTTGVTVPAWTAVLVLSGNYNTSPQSYMQTIFRVQTPAIIDGKMKSECFVFDFAPDRTLNMITQAVKASTKAGKTGDEDRKRMSELLNYLPIIAIEGSKMQVYNVERMLTQLKRAYVERIVRNGFDDSSLYNDDLLRLTNVELDKFNDLKEIIGSTKAMPTPKGILINSQGFDHEEYEELEDFNTKPKKQKRESSLDIDKENKKNRETAISILRGISIRMPLMIYGADITDENKEINLENFVSLIDDTSWVEFMPKGVTKQHFKEFKKYYDPEIFIEAGKRIRSLAKAADNMSIEERIERITNIFSTFRNPDKETVLTPWRVVNMHLGDCIGGYNFFNEDYSETTGAIRFIKHEGVTERIFFEQSKVLEINSKSGLYPLYLAYSLYRVALEKTTSKSLKLEDHQAIWDKVLSESIYVLCRTKMAQSITERTLCGFRKAKTNIVCLENLNELVQQDPQKIANKINNGEIFIQNNKSNKQNSNMELNVVTGNPPYQINDGSGASDDAANPIYHNYVRMSKFVDTQFITLIMPSRWMVGGKVILKPFREEMKKDKRISKLTDYEDSGTCFTTQHIDGGICYFLWDSMYLGSTNYTYLPSRGKAISSLRLLEAEQTEIVVRDIRRLSIIEKTESERTFSNIVSARKPFGINTDLFNNTENYPEYNLSTTKFDKSVFVYGVKGVKGGAQRISGFVSRKAIEKGIDWIDKYKLFISKAYSANAVNPPEIIVASPNEVCTETFLLIGPFNSETEQLNCLKYTKTNFFKVLLFFGRGTMQVSKSVFRFVPLQDFSNTSDIDWSTSVQEIDKQLYRKYRLNREEINFIEKTIRPV